MDERPRINLKDFFEEVMIHHMDQAIKNSLDEFMSDEDLRDKVDAVIKGSREATNAVLASSARSRVPPPEMATAIQMGIIMGVGLALELLNEREITDGGSGAGNITPGTSTIQ